MIGSPEDFGHGLAAARAAIGRGDRADAERMLRDAIGMAEYSAVAESELAAALNELAALRRDTDDLQEAEALFQRALMVLEAAPEPDNAVLLTTLAGLGGVLTDLSRPYLKGGEYVAAEPLLLRLYEIKCRSKGEDHPETATVLASLALVRQALGRHDEAETMWRRVLAVRERTLPPNHFSTATALEHLAESCAARGKVVEALQLLQRAMVMRQLTLGAGHPSLQVARDRMADLQLQGSEDTSGGFAESPMATSPVSQSAPTSHASPPPPPPPPPTTPTPTAHASTPMPTPMPAPKAHVPPPAPAQPVAPPTPTARRMSAKPPRADDAESEFRPASAFVLPTTGGALALQEPSGVRPSQDLVLPVHPGLLAIQAEMAAARAHEEESATQQNRLAALGVAAMTLFQRRRVPVIATGAAAMLVLGAVTTRNRANADLATPETTVAIAQDATPSAALLTARADSLLGDSAPSTRLAPVSAAAGRDVAPPTGAASRAPARIQQQNADVAPARSQSEALVAPSVSRQLMNNIDSFARAVKAPSVSVSESARATTSADASRGRFDSSPMDGSTELVRAQLIGAPPQPRFPEILRDRKIEGDVLVRFRVDAQGRPDLSSITVIRTPHELLTDAVRRVIPGMRFEPAHRARIGAPGEPDQIQMAFQFSNGTK